MAEQEPAGSWTIRRSLTSPEASPELPDAEALRQPRRALPRYVAYGSAVTLFVALIGIAIDSSGAVGLALWAIILVSAALLLGVLLLTQRESDRLERAYRQSLERVKEQFRELSARDRLFGLLAPAEFRTAVRLEVSRSLRHGHACSLLYVEPGPAAIRELSNAGSPDAADVLARFIAESVAGTLRETDVLGRRESAFGVAALLPETDAAGAQAAERRIRKKFEGMKLPPEAGVRLSIPVRTAAASFPEAAQNPEALFALLDELTVHW